MGDIKTNTWMLKWNYVSVISYLVNIILLSIFCYCIYMILSRSIISSTTDIYLKRDLKHRPFLGFVILILAIYILHFLTIKLFFNHSKIIYKLFVRIITSILFVWYFASLYRTFDIFILLRDPKVYVTNIPLLIAGILLPFSESMILKIIEKAKSI